MEVIYKDNTNTIEVEGLRDVDGNFINDAGVVLTAIKDAADVTVVGSGNIAMTYVADSSGVYRGKIPSTLALTAGAAYTALIDITSGTDVGHEEVPLLCKIRTS